MWHYYYYKKFIYKAGFEESLTISLILKVRILSRKRGKQQQKSQRPFSHALSSSFISIKSFCTLAKAPQYNKKGTLRMKNVTVGVNPLILGYNHTCKFCIITNHYTRADYALHDFSTTTTFVAMDDDHDQNKQKSDKPFANRCAFHNNAALNIRSLANGASRSNDTTLDQSAWANLNIEPILPTNLAL